MNLKNQDKKALRASIARMLTHQTVNKELLETLTIEELIAEISVYHQELKYQHEELQRSAQELEESKKLYASWFHDAPTPYVIYNTDHTIRSCNKAFAQFFQKSAYELRGMPLTTFIHPTSQDAFYFKMRKIAAGETISDLELVLAAQPHPITVSVSSDTYIQKDEKLIRSAFFDLTERKAAVTREVHALTTQIEWEEQRFKSLFESNPAVVAVVSLPEYRYREFNRAGLQMLGYTEQEVIGKTPEEVGLFVDFDALSRVRQVMLQTGRLSNAELDIRRKDGTIRNALGFGEIIEHQGEKSLINVLVDITEKKQIEEQLRESEKRYNLALESAGVGIWEWELNTRRLFLSPLAKGMLGYAEDELGDSLEDWKSLWHPEDVHGIQKKVMDYKDGKADRHEQLYRARHKNGEWRWLLSQGALLRDADGKPHSLVGTQTDLSDLIREREKNEELERFFAFTPDLMCISDSQGNLSKVNAAWQRILGYSREELKRSNFFDFLHEEDVRPTLDALAGLKQVDEIRNFHNRYRCQDGSYLQMEWNAHQYGNLVYASARDITQRKEAEEALLLNEERLRMITETMTDTIWVLNIAQGRITYVSPSLLRGFTPEEAMDQGLTGAVMLDSLASVINQIEEASRNLRENPDSIQAYSNEIQQPTKNGEPIWVEYIARCRFNAQNEMEAIGVSRNIEERKKAEQKIICLSQHDQLTALYNRHYFDEKVAEEMIRADRYRLPLSLIILDIDHFKRINDAWGHPVGDRTLQQVAELLSALVREVDVLARLGGEEFVVLLPETREENALIVAEKIRKSIEEEIFPKVGQITVSAGIAERKPSESFTSWYKRTDDALYHAKNSGRNRVIQAPDMGGANQA